MDDLSGFTSERAIFYEDSCHGYLKSAFVLQSQQPEGRSALNLKILVGITFKDPNLIRWCLTTTDFPNVPYF